MHESAVVQHGGGSLTDRLEITACVFYCLSDRLQSRGRYLDRNVNSRQSALLSARTRVGNHPVKYFFAFCLQQTLKKGKLGRLLFCVEWWAGIFLARMRRKSLMFEWSSSNFYFYLFIFGGYCMHKL